MGTAKAVSATGFTLGGADASKYTLANPTINTTADITAKALTPNITVSNKVYDATTSATILTRTLTGIVSPDAVTISGGTATFVDKNVGNGKTVTGSGFTLGGTDAGNYVLVPSRPPPPPTSQRRQSPGSSRPTTKNTTARTTPRSRPGHSPGLSVPTMRL